jgi:biopolymer transport protein ExbD
MKIARKRKQFMVPMNAMSDIAFLLLIFIMLVSLINYRKEVKIDYPQAVEKVQEIDDKKSLSIWVDKEGSVYIDGELSRLDVVEAVLGNTYRDDSATKILLIADRNTEFKNVNAIIEVLQLLEYREVSLIVRD